MDVERYGIVLLPDERTAREAVTRAMWARVYEEDDYLLGGEVAAPYSFPHCTLYQAWFAASDRFRLVQAVHALSRHRGVSAGSLDHYLAYVGGYLFWNVRIPMRRELALLQADVLSAAAPMHRRQPGAGEAAWMSERERDHDRSYGYHLVGAEFIPHITLARVPDMETARSVGDRLPQGEWDCTFDRIGLVLTGPQGQAVERIADFELTA